MRRLLPLHDCGNPVKPNEIKNYPTAEAKIGDSLKLAEVIVSNRRRNRQTAFEGARRRLLKRGSR
jgi:hypothetical protein